MRLESNTQVRKVVSQVRAEHQTRNSGLSVATTYPLKQFRETTKAAKIMAAFIASKKNNQ
jgi:hypothetical protein